MISRAKGYNAWIVIPDDQAEEKYQLLGKLGATVEKVRPVGIVDKGQFVNLAQSRAQEYGKSQKEKALEIKDNYGSETNDEDSRIGDNEGVGYFADQFENSANFEAHFKGTGPEIFQQTDGKIDAFVTGAGRNLYHNRTYISLDILLLIYFARAKRYGRNYIRSSTLS